MKNRFIVTVTDKKMGKSKEVAKYDDQDWVNEEGKSIKPEKCDLQFVSDCVEDHLEYMGDM